MGDGGWLAKSHREQQEIMDRILKSLASNSGKIDKNISATLDLGKLVVNVKLGQDSTNKKLDDIDRDVDALSDNMYGAFSALNGRLTGIETTLANQTSFLNDIKTLVQALEPFVPGPAASFRVNIVAVE